MFEEFGCGCVVSLVQGRVRICGTHMLSVDPPTANGDGGPWRADRLRNVVRQYPANGEMPGRWGDR